MFYGKNNLLCVAMYMCARMCVSKSRDGWRERASECMRALRCSDMHFVFLEVVLVMYGFFSDLPLG